MSYLIIFALVMWLIAALVTTVASNLSTMVKNEKELGLNNPNDNNMNEKPKTQNHDKTILLIKKHDNGEIFEEVVCPDMLTAQNLANEAEQDFKVEIRIF